MARNRYGWEKRAKELARKQKHDEKIKRRQSRARTGKEDEAAEPEAGAGSAPSDIIPD